MFFFTETITRCVNVFLDNANLMKKVFFPRICLPVITVFSSFLNFVIAFFLFLLFLLIIGNYWKISFAWICFIFFDPFDTNDIFCYIRCGFGCTKCIF